MIRLVRNDVVDTSTDAIAAPPTIDATDTASNTPITRPRTSASDDASHCRLGDDFTRDEPGAADHRRDQRDGEQIDTRVHELSEAEREPGQRRR